MSDKLAIQQRTGIEIGWFVPQRVLFFRPLASNSDEVFIRAMHAASDLSRQSDAPALYMLIDASQSQTFPSAVSVAKLKPPAPNHRAVITYGVRRSAWRMIGGVMARAIGMKLIFVDSLQDAIAELQRLDADVAAELTTADFTVVKRFDCS